MSILAVCVIFFVTLCWIVYLFWKIDKLTKQILKLKTRNPTEADLELATLQQIMSEIKRRPVRILMIFPRFHLDEELQGVSLQNVAIEAIGIPPHVAVDVMKVSCDMFDSGEGKFYQEN